MLTLPNNLLVLFFLASAAVFVFVLVKQYLPTKAWQNISAKSLVANIKLPGLISAALIAICAAGQPAGIQVMDGVAFIALGVVIPCLFNVLQFPPLLSGVGLLMLSVLMTMHLDANAYANPIMAALAGMFVYKMIDITTRAQKLDPADPESPVDQLTLEDILPSFIYLSGFYWTHASGASGQQDGILVGALTAALLLRWVQGPFLSNDKLYLKRIVLSTTGALVMLIVIMKILVAVNLVNMAYMLGGSFFLAYLLQETDSDAEDRTKLINAFKQLVVIGIFTLAASRMFGTTGTMLVAAAALVATRPGVAHMAAFFLATKTLVQSYIFQFDPNVTGVNLTHSYTSMALYAGFVIMVALSIMFKDTINKHLFAFLLMAFSFATPVLSNFFLHAEPTASLMIASYVTAILMCILAPVIYGKSLPGHESLLVAPALMGVFAVLSNSLLPMGNEANQELKIKIILGMAAVAFLVWLVMRFSGRTPKAVEVTGN